MMGGWDRAARRAVLLGLYLFVSAGPAAAQDPSAFKKPEAALADADGVHGSVAGDLGVLITAGNSLTTSVAAGAHVDLKKKANRFRFDFVTTFALGDANQDGKLVWDDDLSAFHIQGDLRYDRFVTPRSALYLLGGAFHDPFQHIVVRPHVQIGVSRAVAQTDKHGVVLEVGVDYALEAYGYYLATETPPAVDPLHVFAGRLYGKYQLTLAPNLSFSEELEGLPGVTTDPARRLSVRMNSVTALNIQLAAGVGLKVGFTAAVNFTPPPETKPYDLAGTVNLVAARTF